MFHAAPFRHFVPRALAAAVTLCLTFGATSPIWAQNAPDAREKDAPAQSVTVFAAASLGTALDEIATAWRAETGHETRISLAGSSALARQIEQGAPADIFISANPGWMDSLQEQGLIKTDSRQDLLGNQLVLIAHGGDAPPLPLQGTDMLDDILARLGPRGRLAMALVQAVPAGIYGKDALQHFGLWQALAPRVAQTDNARAALALVAVGAAPLGIVYATDAHAEPRVKIIATFPEDSHDPITYPVAQIARSTSPLAPDFLSFLRGPSARAAFARQGFALLPRPAL